MHQIDSLFPCAAVSVLHSVFSFIKLVC